MAENYNRTPTMILPYAGKNTAFEDPSRPGGRAEQERYSKSSADLAGKICEQMIKIGEQPDYTKILNEVKSGQHGDVNVA